MKRILLFTAQIIFIAFALNAQNRSLQITGDGTWFEVHDMPERLITDCTIEAWVKLDPNTETVDDYTAIVDARDADTANSKALIFKNNSASLLTLSYEWAGDWTFLDEGGLNSVIKGEWHHLAVSISSAEATATFYIDGVNIGTNNTYAGLGTESNFGSSLQIGGGWFTDVRTLIGNIDEVRIWSVAKTQQEIADNMTTELEDPTDPNLIAYYPCNEEDFSTVLTDAGNTSLNASINEGAFNYIFVDDASWDLSPNSINEKNTVKVSTFPNPATEKLFFTGMGVTNFNVAIYDITGKKVIETMVLNNSLDVKNLQKGIYFINVASENNQFHATFIKE